MMMTEKRWIGKPPEGCDICGAELKRCFVDGRTSDGRWGIMCPTCRITEGCEQLGTGLGQKYEARGVGADKVWIKTAG
jgi:hypothetical protein